MSVDVGVVCVFVGVLGGIGGWWGMGVGVVLLNPTLGFWGCLILCADPCSSTWNGAEGLLLGFCL